MKKLISILSLGLLMTSASAEMANFSAFSDGENVYVTILGDSCNSYRPSLIIPNFCKADRLTRNAVASCEVELMIAKTKKACPAGQKPRTFTLNLKNENFAPEAREMIIARNNKVVKVQLKATPKPQSNICYDEDGYHPVSCPTTTVETKTTTEKEETYTVKCSRTNSASCSK